MLIRVNPVAGSFTKDFFEKVSAEAEANNACIQLHTQTNSRFARFYDAGGFIERILKPAEGKLAVSIVTARPPEDLHDMHFFERDYFDGAFSKFPQKVFFHRPILILEKTSSPLS